MKKISTIFRQIGDRIQVLTVIALMSMPLFFSCVDNDDDVPEQMYTSKKITAGAFLEANQDRYGDFTALLKRTPYFAMMTTYGRYTLFAPNNDAMSDYLSKNNYGSVADIPQAICDSIARTHIMRSGAYFTSDVPEGTVGMNMLDAFIIWSSDSDVVNENHIIYYVNKNSRMTEYNDSVTNGVVHTLDRVLSSSTDFLPEKMAEDSTITIFCEAMRLTHMDDSLHKYLDETYTISADSVYTGTQERCMNNGNPRMTCLWVGTRYFKYTAFVEPDSIYRRYGINNIEDLKRYAKQIYDATYPEDAGLYDDDFTNRKNPLNRFVSYHLMDRIVSYNDLVGSDLTKECWDPSICDPEEFYETMCPGTIMRFAGPSAGLFINRKGLQNKFSVRGVKVLSPSESGSIDQNALNGVYHYLDDILAYTTEVRDKVLNCRIRIDATTLSPDFMNCNARGRYGEDKLTGFRNNYIADWKVMGTKAYVGVHSDVGYWNSYQANAVCISGIFDVTFKLPPVPSGTYEIRLGYTCGAERGVVQFYVNNEPCGIPVDLRVYGPDPTIGWVEDTDDKDENTTNDKAMRNHGFMKAMDSYRSENAEKPLRANNWNLRRILTTQYLNANEDYYLRCRQVLEDAECYWSFDYIEICPKSVYASPEGEDTH